VVLSGSAVAWLILRSGLWQAESVLTHLQAAIMFGAASLGMLSGRLVARTSVGFAYAALLVLAFAGAVSQGSGHSARRVGSVDRLTWGFVATGTLLLAWGTS
jgi:hypothetical protein